MAQKFTNQDDFLAFLAALAPADGSMDGGTGVAGNQAIDPYLLALQLNGDTTGTGGLIFYDPATGGGGTGYTPPYVPGGVSSTKDMPPGVILTMDQINAMLVQGVSLSVPDLTYNSGTWVSNSPGTNYVTKTKSWLNRPLTSGQLSHINVMSHTSGKYYLPLSVQIYTNAVGGRIYYTTDGSSPTTSSPSIGSGGSISVSAFEVQTDIKFIVRDIFGTQSAGSGWFFLTEYIDITDWFQPATSYINSNDRIPPNYIALYPRAYGSAATGWIAAYHNLQDSNFTLIPTKAFSCSALRVTGTQGDVGGTIALDARTASPAYQGGAGNEGYATGLMPSSGYCRVTTFQTLEFEAPHDVVMPEGTYLDSPTVLFMMGHAGPPDYWGAPGISITCIEMKP